jgi:2-dehydro-3-deoxyphosphogalactonate aldolase
MNFSTALDQLPLIAVLRGITPAEATAVGLALDKAGFSIIEATMNSPSPLATIEALVANHGEHMLVGAGTVLRPHEVDDVAAAGGRIIVSPNMCPDVIRRTRDRGLISVPGVFTPSEAFAAIDAGANALKLFPAEAIAPRVVRAMKAVLPPDIPLLVTGGITADNLVDYLRVGARGAGMGSALYKPGKPADEVAAAGLAFKAAYARALESL